MSRAVDIPGGPVFGGAGNRPALIAGPCQIEGLDHALDMAGALAAVAARAGFGFVYKSSFDKANRTSGAAPRGVGIDKGLAILAEVRRRIGCPVTTDIHETWQCGPVADVADILQIPAFLCRQTDLLVEAAETGRPVNVKKGPFMAPGDMAHVAGKLAAAGAAGVLLTERGTTFGYHDLVVDFRGLSALGATGWPVVFDATHAAQRPGGADGRSGGNRADVPVLARAAMAAGVDALFLEVHRDPDAAPSDGPNMLRLEDLAGLLNTLAAIDAARRRRPAAPGFLTPAAGPEPA